MSPSALMSLGSTRGALRVRPVLSLLLLLACCCVSVLPHASCHSFAGLYPYPVDGVSETRPPFAGFPVTDACRVAARALKAAFNKPASSSMLGVMIITDADGNNRRGLYARAGIEGQKAGASAQQG